jgi:hypothetical protein
LWFAAFISLLIPSSLIGYKPWLVYKNCRALFFIYVASCYVCQNFSGFYFIFCCICFHFTIISISLV